MTSHRYTVLPCGGNFHSFLSHFSASSSTEDEPEEQTPLEKDLASTRQQLAGLKQSKAYMGLAELIDWVLEKTLEKDNDLKAVHDFINYLVVDKLFVEKYLKLN